MCQCLYSPSVWPHIYNPVSELLVNCLHVCAGTSSSLSLSLSVFYAMGGLTYCLMYWQNSIQFGSTLSRNSSPSTPSEWTCLQTDCQYMEFSLVNLSWGMSTLQNKVKHIILNPIKFKISTTTPKICRLKIPIYKILFYKSTLICKILLFHYHNG